MVETGRAPFLQMIKHVNNQLIANNFEAKFGAKISTSTSSADTRKLMQLDSIQLVKCLYLCDELKIVTTVSVIYTVTDLFVKKINVSVETMRGYSHLVFHGKQRNQSKTLFPPYFQNKTTSVANRYTNSFLNLITLFYYFCFSQILSANHKKIKIS